AREQRDRRAAELGDRDRERDARPGRGLGEEEAERLSRQARLRVRLERDVEIEDRLDLRRYEVGHAEEVAAGERDRQRGRLHDQRFFAAATAAPTSMPRPSK